MVFAGEASGDMYGGLLAGALGTLGVKTVMPEEGEDSAERITPELAPGDVVVGCSSGNFGGFHHRLLARLTEGED